MRVVFFGTPEFAVPSLRALLAESKTFEVMAVVTQPDRPRGRSRSTLVPPPVKVAALEAGIPTLQPEKPVGDLFTRQLEHFQADVGVVAAYGHILRPAILAIPRWGMINVHASLLPRLRGAAPINWAILNGDTTTGISIMRMEAGLDTGPVHHRIETPIEPAETAGDLTARLAAIGARALLDGLALVRMQEIPPTPQDDALATLAPKITRDLARIDWSEDAIRIARRIRAFDPAPGAWAAFEGGEVKLFNATPVPGHGEPGTAVPVEDALVIVTGGGAIRVDEIQPAGKARMPAASWLRGRHGAPLPRFG